MFRTLKNKLLQPKSAMEREVFKIAEYHALIKAKHLGSILLLLYLVIAFLCSIDSNPCFYILVTHNLFPLILRQILNPKHKDEVLMLPMLAKKLNYSEVKYHSNSMSFLCTCLFLLLWQQRELGKLMNLTMLSYTPTAILFLIVALRIGGIFYYRKKFDQGLTYGEI